MVLVFIICTEQTDINRFSGQINDNNMHNIIHYHSTSQFVYVMIISRFKNMIVRIQLATCPRSLVLLLKPLITSS